MNTKHIIELVRRQKRDTIPEEVVNIVQCSPLGQCQGRGACDANSALRQTVIAELAQHFTADDQHFIRFLTREELHATQHTLEHDGLSQLCAYLFVLGQKEDVFLLYDAKYRCGSMDAGSMVDAYMLTLRTSQEKMFAYLEDTFALDKDIQHNYPELGGILRQLYEKPDYESEDEYLEFLRSYYGMHSA